MRIFNVYLCKPLCVLLAHFSQIMRLFVILAFVPHAFSRPFFQLCFYLTPTFLYAHFCTCIIFRRRFLHLFILSFLNWSTTSTTLSYQVVPTWTAPPASPFLAPSTLPPLSPTCPRAVSRRWRATNRRRRLRPPPAKGARGPQGKTYRVYRIKYWVIDTYSPW